MMKMALASEGNKPLRILFLGAHSDDIEIGCGGTILKLLRSGKRISVDWVVFSADEKRKREALASAQDFLKQAEQRRIVIKNFRDGYFPYIGAKIKEYFETLKRNVSPDLVFTHCRHDLHQDHRLLSELTWNTFRNHMILEYECVKYDGDLGSPNVFVHLDEAICRKKISTIKKYFKTQAANHWFEDEAFSSILRIRGIESNAPAGYAEAFYGRKIAVS